MPNTRRRFLSATSFSPEPPQINVIAASGEVSQSDALFTRTLTTRVLL
jgi:hypothetical protein